MHFYSFQVIDTTLLLSLGKATRNCPPAFGRFPLVIISHGFPGNRYLLSHLAENLASKGYCVASIDHLDSLYSECAHPASFPSTLLNRPLDQRFVLDAMGNLEGRYGKSERFKRK